MGEDGVVPAHAGVIPAAPAGCWGRLCRPRTRGGHPAEHTHAPPQAWSSPHTRGSSLDRLVDIARWAVVPAHAGVIRRHAGCPTSDRRRPRTRGGHPDQHHHRGQQEESSPHTRGSSRDRAVRPLAGTVVPAHAGVIPRRRRPAARSPRRPRTRGGHPTTASPGGSTRSSSPHTRGSSFFAVSAAVVVSVVPAHAGVIRAPSSSSPARRGRPRTRGGHPLPVREEGTVTRSSPHTRGSSCRCSAVCAGYVVVPAHAGVIPLGGGSAS